jgi:hypothetical protein
MTATGSISHVMTYAGLGMLISLEFFLHLERCGISSNVRSRKGLDLNIGLRHYATVLGFAGQAWVIGRDRGSHLLLLYLRYTCKAGILCPFCPVGLFLPQNGPPPGSASISLSCRPL